MKILMLVLPLLLFGCADSSQKGVDKQLDILVRISVDQEAGNTGNVYINPNLDWETLSRDSKLESAAAAKATPEFDLTIPIAQRGGTANADSTVEGVKSTQDNRQEDVGNPTTDNSVSTYPMPDPDVSDVTVLDLSTSETQALHWSEDRGRWVTWLDHPAEYYGVPFSVALNDEGGGCSSTYTIEKLDPKQIGSTSFTVVDDLHFGAANPKAAEVLAPLSCVGPVSLTLFYKQ